jgi:hypothetical protein
MNESQSTPVTADQRREARLRRHTTFSGEILLRDGRTGIDAPVVALRDCSPNGASVLMRQAYEPGHMVSLLVSSDGVLTEHLGTIAWCQVASDGELDGRRMPRGSLFFMVGLQMRGPVSLASTLMDRPSSSAR